MSDAKRIRFKLDGCDISFVASAPEDITLKELLTQCDKIRPDWCACGIRSLDEQEKCMPVDIEIDYAAIRKANEFVDCRIVEAKTGPSSDDAPLAFPARIPRRGAACRGTTGGEARL